MVRIDPARLIDTILTGGDECAHLPFIQALLATWDPPRSEVATIRFLRRVISEPATADLMRDFIGATALQRAVSTLLDDTDPIQVRLGIERVMRHLIGLKGMRKILKVALIADMDTDQVEARVAPAIARYMHGDFPFSPADPDPIPTQSTS